MQAEGASQLIHLQFQAFCQYCSCLRAGLHGSGDRVDHLSLRQRRSGRRAQPTLGQAVGAREEVLERHQRGEHFGGQLIAGQVGAAHRDATAVVLRHPFQRSDRHRAAH
ncbi:MAG TPA: hypothetical protein DEO93_00605 [Stenotrophomonas sp.]|nr:hypothetical protein [Stenotrophomonas sp.]